MVLKKRSYTRRRDKQWFDIFASFTFKDIMKYMHSILDYDILIHIILYQNHISLMLLCFDVNYGIHLTIIVNLEKNTPLNENNLY